MITKSTPFYALVLAVLFSGCSGRNKSQALFRPGRLEYDTSELQVTGLQQDPTAQARILDMPFGEAAERLGSLTFNATGRLRVSRGNDKVNETTTAHIEQDDLGDFYVRQKTQTHSIEMYQVNQHVYVRQDTGKLRKKPRRQVDSNVWAERTYSGLREALELFQPQVQLGAGVMGNENQRAVVIYSLGLGGAGPYIPPMRKTAFTPHSRWRELGKPLQLEGSIAVDSATGVIIKADLRGRIEVADRDIRPTELTVSYSSHVTNMNSTSAIVVPAHVDEMRRDQPPRSPLSFFADQLPTDEKYDK